MGILSRMKTVFKSEVNSGLERFENTEKVLNQAVLDIQEQLSKAKQQVAVSVADEKRLKRQYEEHKKLAEDWMEKATLAVQKGSDGLAKSALERKVEYESLAMEYKSQWKAQKASVEKIKVALTDLDSRISAARREKDLLIARNKRAKAQKLVNQTLADLSTRTGTFTTFDRMKRKVDEEEAKAEAATEMSEESGSIELAKQFAELTKPDMDAELVKLKDKVSKDNGASE